MTDEPDGKIVREIFEMRASGKSLRAISDWLYGQGILSPTGKHRWSRETISKLLKMKNTELLCNYSNE